MNKARYTTLAVILAPVLFSVAKAMNRDDAPTILTRFLAQQQPAAVNEQPQHLYTFLASVIDGAKQDTAQERSRAANAERELARQAVELQAVQKRLHLWRIPGVLFFGTTVPIVCCLVYGWLKRNNYLGLEKEAVDLNHASFADDANEVAT